MKIQDNEYYDNAGNYNYNNTNNNQDNRNKVMISKVVCYGGDGTNPNKSQQQK